MDKQEYIEHVMKRILRLDSDNEIDPADIDDLKRHIGGLFDMDFTSTDAVLYMRCCEEVSPDLSEDRALARMKEIGMQYSKYRNMRKGGKKHG